MNYSTADRASPTCTMKIMHHEVDPTKVVVLHSDVYRAAVATDLNR